MSRLMAFVLALALIAGACGGSDDDSSATAATGGDTQTEAAVFQTASGGQIDINDLQGSPTMLWFWAPW